MASSHTNSTGIMSCRSPRCWADTTLESIGGESTKSYINGLSIQKIRKIPKSSLNTHSSQNQTYLWGNAWGSSAKLRIFFPCESQRLHTTRSSLKTPTSTHQTILMWKNQSIPLAVNYDSQNAWILSWMLYYTVSTSYYLQTVHAGKFPPLKPGTQEAGDCRKVAHAHLHLVK